MKMYKSKIFIVLSLCLLLCACSGSDDYPPIDFSKYEVPERPYHEAGLQLEGVKLASERQNPIKNSSMPRIVIDIENDDYLMDKDHYEKATLSIENAGEFNLEATGCGIKIRGNSTAEAAKRPLKVKFDEKQGLLGKEPAKSWVLLANVYDKSLLHNYIAYDLYNYLTPENTFCSMCEMVEVYAEDSFLGIYTLCDQVEVGNGRVNINKKIGDLPENTDYFIELDYRVSYDDPQNGIEGINWFWMSYYNDCFEIKSPELDIDQTEYGDYIRNYIDETYEIILSKNWERINSTVDVESFMYGMLVADMVRQGDVYKTSVYMFKPAAGKLTYGPLWDCDLAMGCGEAYAAEKSITSLGNRFMGALMEVPEFKEMYLKKYNSIYEDVLEHMYEKIDYAVANYHEELECDYDFWERNYNLCDPEIVDLSYDEQIDYLKNWLRVRFDWLYEQYNNL